MDVLDVIIGAFEHLTPQTLSVLLMSFIFVLCVFVTSFFHDFLAFLMFLDMMDVYHRCI